MNLVEKICACHETLTAADIPHAFGGVSRWLGARAALEAP